MELENLPGVSPFSSPLLRNCQSMTQSNMDSVSGSACKIQKFLKDPTIFNFLLLPSRVYDLILAY